MPAPCSIPADIHHPAIRHCYRSIPGPPLSKQEALDYERRQIAIREDREFDKAVQLAEEENRPDLVRVIRGMQQQYQHWRRFDPRPKAT